MRCLIAMLLAVSTIVAQSAPQFPAQGPPPKDLAQRPDGRFSANADPANPERYEVHVVQQGDTLSQIAGRVLNNPRLWPQLWEQNEHIVNPHWIYPNDRILIRPITQITEAVPPEPPSEPEGPAAAPAPAPPAVEAQPGPAPPPTPAPVPAPRQAVFELKPARPVPEIKPGDVLCSGFVQRAEIPRDFKVLGKFNAAGGVLATETDYVYVSKGSEDGIAAGKTYQVIRPTRRLQDVRAKTRETRNLGMHYMDVAQLQVVLTQADFSLARIVRGCEAVEIGDIMIPFQEPAIPELPRPRNFSPFMRVTGDVKGSIVITKDILLNSGSVFKASGAIPGIRGGHLGSLEKGIAVDGRIVFLNVGRDHGVRAGDIFIVYRDIEREDRLYDLPEEVRKLKGQRTAIAEAVVVKAGERASTALLTYSADAVFEGDSVERR